LKDISILPNVSTCFEYKHWHNYEQKQRQRPRQRQRQRQRQRHRQGQRQRQRQRQRQTERKSMGSKENAIDKNVTVPRLCIIRAVQSIFDPVKSISILF